MNITKQGAGAKSRVLAFDWLPHTSRLQPEHLIINHNVYLLPETPGSLV